MNRPLRDAPHIIPRGISLVELLLALVLGLVVILAVSQVYLASKQTWRMQEAQARLQENARLALEALVRDARLAGYNGCADVEAPDCVAWSGSPALEPEDLGALANPPGAGTGVLTTRFFRRDSLQSAAVLVTRSYYIARDTADAPSGRLSLRRRENGDDLGSLVEGVDNLQILYGEDTDAVRDCVPNQYRSAQAVSNWSRVAAVRLDLCLRTLEDRLLAATQTLSGVCGAGAAADLRVRRAFGTTVRVRGCAL